MGRDLSVGPEADIVALNSNCKNEFLGASVQEKNRFLVCLYISRVSMRML